MFVSFFEKVFMSWWLKCHVFLSIDTHWYGQHKYKKKLSIFKSPISRVSSFSKYLNTNNYMKGLP